MTPGPEFTAAGQFSSTTFSASMQDMIARPSPVSDAETLGVRVTDVIGPNALSRFDRDVLAQSGVTHVVLLEGINDLGLANGATLPTAADIIAGHKQIIERAHSHGLKVIAGTFLPFEGTNLGEIGRAHV